MKDARERTYCVEGADHANSAMTDYEAYEEAVMGFYLELNNNTN